MSRLDHELDVWVRVRLDQADPEEVFELLEEAWRMTATKRAVTAHDGCDGSCGGIHPRWSRHAVISA